MEALVRDQVELKRQQLRESDLGRVGGIEIALAVLKTRFEAALERAVSGDDLKELKREVDDHMKQTVTNIQTYFDSKTDQQSSDILQKVQLLLAQERQATIEDNRNLRRQVFMSVFASGLSIIAALIVFRLTSS